MTCRFIPNARNVKLGLLRGQLAALLMMIFSHAKIKGRIEVKESHNFKKGKAEEIGREQKQPIPFLVSSNIRPRSMLWHTILFLIPFIWEPQNFRDFLRESENSNYYISRKIWIKRIKEIAIPLVCTAPVGYYHNNNNN